MGRRIALAARAALVAALPVLLILPAWAAPAGGPRLHATDLVGHLDPHTGTYADVWVADGTAYLGGYGCANGPGAMWAIDVRDPAHPRTLARFAGFAGSDAQDVWAGAVRTRAFSGHLAAVGIQRCQSQAPGTAALALFDVGDPAHPRQLAVLPTGVRSGVHELGVAERPDGRLLALLAVPGSYLESGGRSGDLRIVDVTDPRHPVQVNDWDVRRDGPPAARAALEARPDVFCHSAWPFARGSRLFASFWAAGVQFLDLADPAAPKLIGQTTYRPGERQRAAHSGWFNAAETLFVQNDEVLSLETAGQGTAGQGTAGQQAAGRPSWSFQRIWDTRDLRHPVQVATFATEDAVPGADGTVTRNGIYSVHNAVLVGSLEYVSWYSDGVRIVDLADPAHPREVGSFVPPPGTPHGTPHGLVQAPDGSASFPLVWGVYPSGGLAYASDMASGLWIIRYPGTGSQPAGGSQAGGPATTASGGQQVSRGRRIAEGAIELGLFAALVVTLAVLAHRRGRRPPTRRRWPPTRRGR